MPLVWLKRRSRYRINWCGGGRANLTGSPSEFPCDNTPTSVQLRFVTPLSHCHPVRRSTQLLIFRIGSPLNLRMPSLIEALPQRSLSTLTAFCVWPPADQNTSRVLRAARFCLPVKSRFLLRETSPKSPTIPQVSAPNPNRGRMSRLRWIAFRLRIRALSRHRLYFDSAQIATNATLSRTDGLSVIYAVPIFRRIGTFRLRRDAQLGTATEWSHLRRVATLGGIVTISNDSSCIPLARAATGARPVGRSHDYRADPQKTTSSPACIRDSGCACHLICAQRRTHKLDDLERPYFHSNTPIPARSLRTALLGLRTRPVGGQRLRLVQFTVDSVLNLGEDFCSRHFRALRHRPSREGVSYRRTPHWTSDDYRTHPQKATSCLARHRDSDGIGDRVCDQHRACGLAVGERSYFRSSHNNVCRSFVRALRLDLRKHPVGGRLC